MQKLTLMNRNNQIIHIENWIEKRISMGRLSFSLKEIREAIPEKTDLAIKAALLRLSKKKRVLSIHKGFYLIIMPRQSGSGMIQPILFIDSLMKYLERDYYVGLLSAAALHGAAHQRAQETFVFTTFPVLRPTLKEGIKINYISKKETPDKLLQEKKTEAGYLKVSSPVLTAVDLVQFETRTGGLNRATTVINELAESIKPKDFTKELIDWVQ